VSLPRRLALFIVAGCLFAPRGALAQSRTVFDGRPSVKVSEGGIERTPETLTPEKAANLHCVISEIGGKFYWASRGNVLMAVVEAGAFTTYIAANGSGYVRVIKPADKAAASSMSATETSFDYVEHLMIGLRTITYYGRRAAP
jgi:hypothetical protein